MAVTGGSFSNITNILTLTNITGGTIPITGFTSFDRAISAFTYNNANTFTIDDNSGNTYNATIDIVTGFTINGDLNVSGNTNLDGITQIYSSSYQTLPILSVTGTSIDFDFNAMDFTGDLSIYGPLVVTGNTTLNGLTATTISATTYQNLPVSFDRYVTGFTYSPNTFTITDNSGVTYNATIDIVSGLTVNGDLLVTGNTNVDGLTATTISATTYQNLPIDPDTYVTGFTYSANTFTIADNSGSTFDATINVVTGLTVNGDFNVSGDTTLDGPVTINITS